MCCSSTIQTPAAAPTSSTTHTAFDSSSMAATAAAVAVSALTNKGVRVSHDIQDLRSSSINIVHVQRPHIQRLSMTMHNSMAVHDHASALLSKPGLQVCISLSYHLHGEVCMGPCSLCRLYVSNSCTWDQAVSGNSP